MRSSLTHFKIRKTQPNKTFKACTQISYEILVYLEISFRILKISFLQKRFAYILGESHFIFILTTTTTKLVHCLPLVPPATFVTLFYHVKVNLYSLYQDIHLLLVQKTTLFRQFPQHSYIFFNFSMKICPSRSFLFLRKINSNFGL